MHLTVLHFNVFFFCGGIYVLCIKSACECEFMAVSVCMCVYMHTCIMAYVSLPVRHLITCVCVCVLVRGCVCVRAHVCVCMCVCVCVCVW